MSELSGSGGQPSGVLDNAIELLHMAAKSTAHEDVAAATEGIECVLRDRRLLAGD